jgi:transposase-like protein
VGWEIRRRTGRNGSSPESTDRAILAHGQVVIDKSGSNAAGLFNMNYLLVLQSWCWLIEVLQVKYLNNIIEQDHRFIKKITRPIQTFKSFNPRRRPWPVLKLLT